MKNSTRTAILLEVSKVDSLVALYGMGSFFRGGAHRDVDLIAVVDCPHDKLLRVADIVRRTCGAVDWGTRRPVHTTILTPSEFAQRPLRDFDSLVLLFSRDIAK